MGGKGKGGGGGISMVRRVAKEKADTCVWIGGLKGKKMDKEMNKKLKAHIEENGGEGVKFVDIGPNGSGGAIFGTAEEATNAISILNGTTFEGKELEFDVYVKGWKGD